MMFSPRHVPRLLILWGVVAGLFLVCQQNVPRTWAQTAGPRRAAAPDSLLLSGIDRDSIPGTVEGLPATTSTADLSRRDFNQNCFEVGCHAQRRETRWLHGPAAVGACQACHQAVGPPAQHRFEPTRPQETLCTPCHHPETPEPVRHDPFVKSECVQCHDPHGGRDKTFIREPTTVLLCARCHDGQEHDGVMISAGPRPVAFPHDPVVKGDCSGCHDSHQTSHQNLLVREPKQELCLGCHRQLVPLARAADGRPAGYEIPDPLFGEVSTFPTDDPGLLSRDGIPATPPADSLFYYLVGPIHGAPFAEAAPMDTVDGVVGKLVLVHQPLTEDCSSCHLHHGSDIEHLLRDEPRALCEGCHGEKMSGRLTTAVSHHGQAFAKDGCGQCHADHASGFAHLLKSSSRKLCLDCHDEAIRVDLRRQIPNIQAQCRDAASVHEPVEQGCVACHLSHASVERRLLRGVYPAGNYAAHPADAHDFCFSCHEKANMVDEFTTRTGFRNGDHNLHYLHVIADKGRSCGTCHQAHGSPRLHLIRESTPWGPSRWSLPIDYEQTESGGSCNSGCHRRLRYDRDRPVTIQSGETTGISRD
ncbi:MAG: cytochrome c3 family protein [bacterium]